MMRMLVLVGAAVAFAAPGAPAQSRLEDRCHSGAVETFGGQEARNACVAAAQAAVSAQPVLGILIAGGSPTIGTAGAGGLRLGIIPRIGAGLRLNVVPVRLPDIVAAQVPGQAGELARKYGAPVPALQADVSVGLFPGMTVSPGLGGIGGISLLGSASYLPFEMFTDDFDRNDLAYGFGARLHVLNESFIAPGVSVSLMRRRLGAVQFGDICPGGAVPVTTTSDGVEVGGCAGSGDVGEIGFDLTNWSTRAVASKHFLGLGASIGIGHDRYDSDLDFGFRGSAVTGTNVVSTFQVRDEEIDATRWNVFGNLSFSMLVATLAVEAGWQQGKPPIRGFSDLRSDFDPRSGSWFGSVGARLAL